MSVGGYAMAEESAPMAAETTYRPKKVKKPNFLKRWMLTMVKDAVSYDRDTVEKEQRISDLAIKRQQDVGLSVDPMRFSIYKAHGGFVVEVRTPSINTRQISTSDSTTKLHIIRGDCDLGEELAKIITFEGLRA